MSGHRFSVGKVVDIGVRQERFGVIPPGAYEVVRLLPAGVDGINQYRVKSLQNGHERVVKESELSLEARGDTPPPPR